MSFDIGGAIQGALIGFSQTGTPWGAVAGAFVGGFGVGDAKRSARNKARDAYNAAQSDRAQMVQSATAPQTIIFGRARASGPIAYAQASGDMGEFLHLIVLHAGHECDGAETAYFNETALTLDGSGYVTNSEFSRATLTQVVDTGTSVGASTDVTLVHAPVEVQFAGGYILVPGPSGDNEVLSPLPFTAVGSVVTIDTSSVPTGTSLAVRYTWASSSTPLARIKTYLGTADQLADADLIAASGGKWTANHRLRGLAYSYVRLEYDQDVFGALGIPNFSRVMRGHKWRDPRTSLTTWTDNAALCTAGYLTEYMGATLAQIPSAELIAEADVCDELVALDALGATEARYTVNGVLSTEASPRANLEALCEAMASPLPVPAWAQGRYAIQCGRHLSPTLTITEGDLADGPIVIQPESSRADQINRVVASYVEPGRSYTTVEAPPVTNALYVADDGGIDLPTELQLDMCTGSLRAQRLAKILLERARQGMRVQLTCNLHAYDVRPGVTVALTIGRYGWSGKLFMVEARTHDLARQTVALTLRETAAGVWDWAYGSATAIDLTPNTSLPSPFEPPAALTGLNADTGTSWLQLAADGSIRCRAHVTWNAATSVHVVRGGHVELRWSLADSDVWVQEPRLSGDSVEAIIGPLEEGRAIIIGVRPVNSIGVAGAWSYISRIPVGKTAPPSNVANFAASVVPGAVLLTWDRPTDLDWLETELRLGTSWASSTLLYRGANTLYPWAWPAVGSYVVLAKHRDTSRNESAAVAQMPVTVNADGTISFGGVTWFTGGGLPATWGGVSSWTVPPVTHLVDTAELHLEAATTVITSFQLGPIDFSSGA